MAIFAILNKYTQEVIFYQLGNNGEKYGETAVLIISAILSKIENEVVFGQICYPEQKSDKRLF